MTDNRWIFSDPPRREIRRTFVADFGSMIREMDVDTLRMLRRKVDAEIARREEPDPKMVQPNRERNHG